MILRIKHLVCTGEACLLSSPQMKLPDSDDTAQHVLLFLRIRLVQHALVAEAHRTRFVCVDSRHDKYLVLHLILNISQTSDILHYRILIVRRTRSDDQQKLVRLARKNILELPVTVCSEA